ncbi:hypothetical protein CEQ21_16085 [Niallia circulans]|uniref:Uncharacterized protein n=1 Tax=Niallia circulans TaxID=1397 RepID=A0A553SQ17_NIACI|nr:hypothetical protein CEQ21_16085 [Niallia circulans]
MVEINRNSVLERAFGNLTKSQVIEVLKKFKNGFVLDKSKKNKSDLKEEFLLLGRVLSSQDIINLAEMAVMKRKKGLSAYTYKLNNLGKLNNKTPEQIKTEFMKSFVITPQFEVVMMDIESDEKDIILKMSIKEYGTYWKMGVQDISSLTAVYHNTVTIEKSNSKISVEAGGDNIEDVIEKFLLNRLNVSFSPYNIRIFNAPTLEMDSASEKTMLILDFIYNRLPSRGISSSFNDVKFKLNSTSQSGGLKGVTIHGNDIINSDEACKYITLSNDIISFKTTSIYNGIKVNVHFSLKGKEYDKLKIVILDNKDEDFKLDVLNHIQEEYILMCNNGIMDIEATRRILEPIYSSFIASHS